VELFADSVPAVSGKERKIIGKIKKPLAIAVIFL
jgi:hypothetical protein